MCAQGERWAVKAGPTGARIAPPGHDVSSYRVAGGPAGALLVLPGVVCGPQSGCIPQAQSAPRVRDNGGSVGAGSEGTHDGRGAVAEGPSGRRGQGRRPAARRAVPAGWCAGPGRYGHGVAGRGRDAGADRRGEGAAVPLVDRRGGEAAAHHADPARGEGHRPYPQQRRGHRLRRRGRGRPAVDRDGADRGQVPRRGDPGGRHAHPQACRRGRAGHPRGAPCRPS